MSALEHPHPLAVRARGLLIAALVLAIPFPARASGTDPLLTLTQAQSFSTAGGIVAVDVRGVLPVEDYVQVVFPAGLLVTRGSSWTRYEFGGGAVSGSDASVSDGVTAAEMMALLGSGDVASAPARVVRTEPGRVQVVLPPELAAGTLSVRVYAVLEGEAFLSNALTVTAP